MLVRLRKASYPNVRTLWLPGRSTVADVSCLRVS